MTVLHWDERTYEAIARLIDLLFCCGVPVTLDHTYEENDKALLLFLKRKWFVGLKSEECYMVHTTTDDHLELVEKRTDFKSIEDMTLYVKLNFLRPRSVADLQLITADMPFDAETRYLDDLPYDVVETVQDDARKIIPTLPTYEEYKGSHREDYGDADCFVGSCPKRALYPKGGYGFCEEHSGIRSEYLTNIMYECRKLW